MSIYEATLLFVGMIAGFLCLVGRNRRAAVWVSAIMVDLVLSTAWWRAGLPFGDVFTGACDFSVCIAIFIFGRWRWELRLYILFQFSVLISLCDFAASIWSPEWIEHDVYSSFLELVNYLAFISLGGIGAFALASGSVPPYRVWNRVLLPFLPLRGKGQKAPR